MYNSQNSASSKVSFTSAVLAQAILLDIPTFFNGVTNLDTQSVYNKVVRKIDLFMQVQQTEFIACICQGTSGKISLSDCEFEV